MNDHRKDRIYRIAGNNISGIWGTSSQDYIRHSTKLFEHSANYARTTDGNCSPYTLSGLPILFAALRALLIEANSGINGKDPDNNALKRLGKEPNDLLMFFDKYQPEQDHKSRLSLLYETRNEIIHPAHMPTGTTHGTPISMMKLRALKLLQSTNNEEADYLWISQLQSHRLFIWAFSTIEDAAVLILRECHQNDVDYNAHIQSYTRYKDYFQ